MDDPRHDTSVFKFFKDGKEAWFFCDSKMSLAQLYDIAQELRAWAYQGIVRAEEAGKKDAEEKKEPCSECEQKVE